MPAQDTGGVVLADRYDLRSEIGTGGMGVVWRAHDTLLARDVAVKEVHLPPDIAGGDQAIMQGRVLREARAAARLSHPAAVTVYDVVHHEGRAYIVMELIDAPTLALVVERDGPLPPERVAALGLEILGALEKAHAEGIVHRDVKPQNVMLGPAGAKLADFGIASLKGDPKLTATGILLGSPSFMAPEQAQGDDSGPPADLWGLGATLYYAVEGQPPFGRGQPIATLASVVYDEPRSPQRAGPLAAVLMRLMSKAATDRLSAADLRAALERVAGEDRRLGTSEPELSAVRPSPRSLRDESSRPAEAAAIGAERVWATTGEPGWRSEHRPAPRRGLPLWALAAGAFLVALLVGLLLFRPSSAPSERRPPDGSGQRQDAGGRGADRQGNRGQNGGGGGGDASAGETQAPDTGAAAGAGFDVPVDWVTYEDPSSGFSISHPPDWEVIVQSRDADSLDIEDPAAGGTYLRIDWTDSPGPSPLAAWEAQAESFAARHDNYEEIQIEPTTFKGFEAAIWEFTYSDGGVDLHAADIGFVTDDYGFALFWQTQAEAWEDSRDLFQAFQASFQPPA
jgi:serine/threonine protein kinase